MSGAVPPPRAPQRPRIALGGVGRSGNEPDPVVQQATEPLVPAPAPNRAGPTEPQPRRTGRTRWPALNRVAASLGLIRDEPPVEPVVTTLCCALVGLAFGAGLAWGTVVWSPSVQVLPLLVGGLLLRPRALLRVTALVALALLVDTVVLGWRDARIGTLIAVAATALLTYEVSRSRAQTGLVGLRGDGLLTELRRRLALQGDLPPLPAGWAAETVLLPAGGAPFAGDFVVSALSHGDRRLDLALVDVSGKGLDAGTRALLLSGALGGLLGSGVDFLPAANGYLLRQAWDEGFATAVYLTVDLADGDFVVASAGHPPAAWFDGGSGRWSLLGSDGPALGLLPDATFTHVDGRLNPGDALLLYTDGLVEVPGRDLSVGIDKLLGEAERLVARGFAGGSRVLVQRVAPRSSDDRALVLLWRPR